jgi:hypothetical protein
MHRARAPRSLALVLTPALAAAAYLGLPSEAEAARPQRSGGFDEGGYIIATPGSLVLPFAGNDFEDDYFDLNPTYGWGFGGGYMFSRGPLFKATVGGVLEHYILIFDDLEFDEFGGHVIRVMPEARIGLGNNKVWGYGLFGAGPAFTVWRWNYDVPFFDDVDGSETAFGFNAQFGGGVQGIVYKNLFLGGEVDFDLGFYFEGDEDDWRGNNDDDFAIYSVAFEFLIGWYF